jgi:hypothetical protein
MVTEPTLYVTYLMGMPQVLDDLRLDTGNTRRQTGKDRGVLQDA